MAENELTLENIYEKTGLRVIGWVDYYDNLFDDAPLTDEVYLVVARAVKDGGYLFGGDTHQDGFYCCPLLNNGTAARFSWRGWGMVIALAYDIRGKNGNYDHIAGYMSQLIKPEAIKTPKGEDVDYTKLVLDHPQKTIRLPLLNSQDLFATRQYIITELNEETEKLDRFDCIAIYNQNMQAKYLVMRSYRASDPDCIETVLSMLEEHKEYIWYDNFGYEKDNGEMSREELLEHLHADYPDCKRAILFHVDLIDFE